MPNGLVDQILRALNLKRETDDQVKQRRTSVSAGRVSHVMQEQSQAKQAGGSTAMVISGDSQPISRARRSATQRVPAVLEPEAFGNSSFASTISDDGQRGI